MSPSTPSVGAIPPLVRFYDPHVHAADSSGRTLSTILAWPDRELEYRHDYIQTIFPLPEASPFNPDAPIVNKSTFLAFHTRPELRVQLLESFKRMLQFYGFTFTDTQEGEVGRRITPSPQRFEKRARIWVMRFNHNHLRITRIIRSLRVLGCGDAAEEFFLALKRLREEYKGVIGAKSFIFWERAATRPLHIAPEMEGDGLQRGFLWEFEMRMLAELENEKEDVEAVGGVKDENGTNT